MSFTSQGIKDRFGFLNTSFLICFIASIWLLLTGARLNAGKGCLSSVMKLMVSPWLAVTTTRWGFEYR
jgi:hypothetical protein